MSRATLLRQNLDTFGVKVVEVDGWQNRGNTSFRPRGSVNHHTACAPPRSPGQPVAPSLGICTNGRGGASPVPGPLCNVLLGRDLWARLIAANRSNNAGQGGVRGLSGNSSVWGLEVEHCGVPASEPVTADLVEASARIHAAFAATSGFTAEYVVQHHEWTTRKIDFCKGHLSPEAFRARVGELLRAGGANPSTPTPAPSPGGFLMTLTDAEQREILNGVRDLAKTADRKAFAVRDPRDGRVWVCDASGRWWCQTMELLNVLIFTGAVQGFGTDGVAVADPSWLDKLPVTSP